MNKATFRFLFAAMLGVVCSSAQAAWVNFAITNSDGTASSDLLRIYPITTPINVNGSWYIKGVPTRVQLVNGTNSAYLLQGNYAYTNTRPIIFAVPSGTNTYNAAALEISGGNIYNYNPVHEGGTVDTNTVLQLAQQVVSTNVFELSSISDRGNLDLWATADPAELTAVAEDIASASARLDALEAAPPAENVQYAVTADYAATAGTATNTSGTHSGTYYLTGSTNIFQVRNTNANTTPFWITPDDKLHGDGSLLTGVSATFEESVNGFYFEVLHSGSTAFGVRTNDGVTVANGLGITNVPRAGVTGQVAKDTEQDGRISTLEITGGGGGGVAYSVSNRVTTTVAGGSVPLATIQVGTNQVKGARLLVIGRTTESNLVQVLNIGVARDTGDPVITSLTTGGGTDYSADIASLQSQIGGLDSTYATDAEVTSALSSKADTSALSSYTTLTRHEADTNTVQTAAATYADTVKAAATNGLLTHVAATYATKAENVSSTNVLASGIAGTYATKAENVSSTNLLATAIAAVYQPLLPDPITNGYSPAMTFNGDVTVNGNFTVNSTNATTTVSNIVVGGTLTGGGVNTLSNSVYVANKTLTEASTNITVLKVNSNNIVGVIPVANLGTGTPDGTKFLRDDGTLATPSGGSVITNWSAGYNLDAGLSKWRSVIGNCETGRVHVIAIGDSITEGHNTLPSDVWGRATNGWVGRLRAKLQREFGGSGIGFIPMHRSGASYAGLGWTLSAGWSIGTVGAYDGGPIGLGRYGTAATVTAILDPVTCSSFEVFWTENSFTGDSFTIYTNDVLACTIAQGTTLRAKSTNIQAVLSGGKIEIKCPGSSKYLMLNGAAIYSSTNGVYVHNLGLNGAVSPAATTSASWSAPMNPALTLVMFDSNDTAGQTATNTYFLKMSNVLSGYTNYGSAVLIAGPYRAGTPEPQTTYHALGRAAAAANNASVLSVFDRWGGAAMQTRWSADATHPTRNGHTDIANYLFPFLTE